MSTTGQRDDVDVFAPWAGEKERALRLSIRKAQVVAAARAAREQGDVACEIYTLAAEVAHRWVFRRVEDIETLDRVRYGLCQLFVAANNIAQAERSGGK